MRDRDGPEEDVEVLLDELDGDADLRQVLLDRRVPKSEMSVVSEYIVVSNPSGNPASTIRALAASTSYV